MHNNNDNQNNPFKSMFIFLIVLLGSSWLWVIVCILAPLQLIGSIFNNTWGTPKSYFGYDYTGNFSHEIDQYIKTNRTSIDYKQLLACALADLEKDPKECLDVLDSTGAIHSNSASEEYFYFDWPEYHGTYASTYFSNIHVTGKYTVSKYEKIDEHTEYVDKDDGAGNKYRDQVTVADYDWVYYSDTQRGKCISDNDTKCYIELDDKYVYPFQYVGAGIKERYGLRTADDYSLKIEPFQVWRGTNILAFSKGEIITASPGKITLKIDANGIDLIATYEGGISCLFKVGDKVEAGELIGYSDGEFTFYVQNSASQYINPSLFLESVSRHFNGKFDITSIPNYSLLEGSLNGYKPDFSNTAAWKHSNEGGTNPYAYGQCTWFAYGVFYELYGHAPNTNGNGTDWANNLQESGWSHNQTIKPGSMVSSRWLPDHPFGTVAIVAEVNDDGTMWILHGNSNASLSEDPFDIAIYDWSVQKVSVDGYTFNNGSYAAWDVASPPS